MSDLLKEAIADAKAVRETAMRSAKIALEEAFQPTIQRMISAKLSEEDEEDFSDEEATPEPAPEPEPEFGEDEPTPAPEPEPEPEGEDDLELEALIRELEGEDEFEDEFVDEGEEDYMDDGEDGTPAEMGDSLDESDDENLDLELEALIREIEGEDDIDDEEMDFEPEMEEGRRNRRKPVIRESNLRTENRKLKSKLNEAYRAISTMKAAISEVNLLNAKLMYCTKILRGTTLSESAQTKILKQFDRATNIREVKLIYTTLAESIKKQQSGKKNLSEGASRREVAITNKSDKFSFAPRWQQIAGIKKK